MKGIIELLGILEQYNLEVKGVELILKCKSETGTSLSIMIPLNPSEMHRVLLANPTLQDLVKEAAKEIQEE